jgi:hypothetical protein
MPRKSTALEGLSPGMSTFYRGVNRRYALSEHHRKRLMCAAQAHTRMEAAQQLIRVEGLTVVD